MAMSIKMKQTQLHFLGYYNDRIDGIWGNNSYNGTLRFQKENGLAVDGIFGPNTEAKSIEIVTAIQKIVKKYSPNMVVDGLAGNITMSAVRSYQKAMGLKVTGIANAETRKTMKVGNTDDNGNISQNPNDPEFDTGNTKPSTGTWWDKIKYFERSEFKCHCGGRYCNGFPYEPKQKLVQVADRAREYFGKPAIVSSGVRCTTHNKNVGGVYNSRHLTGHAMDFHISGVSANTLLAYVSKQPEIQYAYAIDGNYVHMQIAMY